MKFFAQSFEAHPPTWHDYLGCFSVAVVPFLVILAFLGSLVYFGYWLGAQ